MNLIIKDFTHSNEKCIFKSLIHFTQRILPKMLYALLLVSISLIGFLLASILFSKRKANSYYNKYAVALILIISLRIFLVGLHLTFKKEICKIKDNCLPCQSKAK